MTTTPLSAPCRRGLTGLSISLAMALATLNAMAAPKPHPELDRFLQQVGQLRQSQQAKGQGKVQDQTPPTLIAFNAEPKLNPRHAGTQWVFNVQAKDDLSGVSYLYVHVTGPDGQSIGVSDYADAPDRNWRRQMAQDSSPYTGPGIWSVDYLYLADFAGNTSYYDHDALAALGNTEVEVINRTFDIVAPTLANGVIKTPVISLASHPRGLPNSSPYARVDMTLGDSGGQFVSGIAYAQAYFCQFDDNGGCSNGLSLNGHVSKRGASAATLETASSTYYQQVLGVYQLYYVYVVDHAGNTLYLLNKDYGGDTDFSLYFPSTTIELQP